MALRALIALSMLACLPLSGSSRADDVPPSLQRIIQYVRDQCAQHMRDYESALKAAAGQAGLQSKEIAQVAQENARTQSWLAEEQKRLAGQAEALKLAGPAAPELKGLAALRDRIRQDTSLKVAESAPREFSFEGLHAQAIRLVRNEAWNRAVENHLAQIERQHPEIVADVAQAGDPPVIRHIISEMEKAADLPKNASNLDEFQKRIDSSIDARVKIEEVRLELLGELRALQKDGRLSTPTGIDELTRDNTRAIERAAVVYFQVEHDPSQAAEKAKQEQIIAKKWHEILLAHDVGWVRKMEEAEAIKLKAEKGISSCENGRFWAGFASGLLPMVGGLFVARPYFPTVAHPYEYGSLPVAIIFTGAMVGMGAMLGAVAINKAAKAKHEAALKAAEKWRAQPTRSLTEVRDSVVSYTSAPPESCLSQAYRALLDRLSPASIQAAQIARMIVEEDAAGSSGPLIHVGDAGAEHQPLVFASREEEDAAVHALAQDEAEVELDGMLKSAGCRVK